MSVSWSKVGKPLAVDDITHAEQSLGLSIPQQFREFLLTTNGGVPKPRKIAGHSCRVTYILDLAGILRTGQQYWSEMDLPNHQLPIGFADEVDLLVLDGEKVVIHTNCEGGIGRFGAGTEELAASFKDFLAMLTKPAPPSNNEKFVEACQIGDLKKVQKILANGVDWDAVAVPAFAAAFSQLIGGVNDYTLLTMLFEGGAPCNAKGEFSSFADSMSIGDFIKEEILPNERNALNLFDAGTRAGDQVRIAVAQIENILAKWFGG